MSSKMSSKATQLYNKGKQQAAKLGGVQWIMVVFLMLVLPFFTIFLTKHTLDVAKKPIDATTSTGVKKVHDRDLLLIISLFLANIFFLNFYYITSDYFPKMIFIPINVAFAMAIVVISSQTVQKINAGGKNNEYKQYVDVLAAILFFSIGILVVYFVNIVYSLFFESKSKPTTAAAAA